MTIMEKDQEKKSEDTSVKPLSPAWTRSKVEELFCILWFILAAISIDKVSKFTLGLMLAMALLYGFFALKFAAEDSASKNKK